MELVSEEFVGGSVSRELLWLKHRCSSGQQKNGNVRR
jgi:hypothetical protein